MERSPCPELETDTTQNVPGQSRGNGVEATAPQTTAGAELPCTADLQTLQKDIAEQRARLDALTIETFRKMRAILS